MRSRKQKRGNEREIEKKKIDKLAGRPLTSSFKHMPSFNEIVATILEFSGENLESGKLTSHHGL